jgi:tetratricopeptide (TPR) repeat protein
MRRSRKSRGRGSSIRSVCLARSSRRRSTTTSGLYDRALATLKQAATFDSVAPALSQWTGSSSEAKANFIGAVDAFEQAIRLGDRTAATRCYYAHALGRAGHREQAVRELRELQRQNTVVAPTFLAIAYLGLGDRERAIAELQAAFAARDPLLQYIVVESYLDALMDDPTGRFITSNLEWSLVPGAWFLVAFWSFVRPWSFVPGPSTIREALDHRTRGLWTDQEPGTDQAQSTKY